MLALVFYIVKHPPHPPTVKGCLYLNLMFILERLDWWEKWSFHSLCPEQLELQSNKGFVSTTLTSVRSRASGGCERGGSVPVEMHCSGGIVWNIMKCSYCFSWNGRACCQSSGLLDPGLIHRWSVLVILDANANANVFCPLRCLECSSYECHLNKSGVYVKVDLI